MSDDITNHLIGAIKELSGKLDSVRTEIAATNLSVARLETEVRLKACPAPGSCLVIGPRLTALEERVLPLEQQSLRREGGKATLYLVASLASGGGAFLAWCLQMYLGLK